MLLIFTLNFVIAAAQQQISQVIRVHLQQVKRWGGWILIGVGVWFVVLSLFADVFVRWFLV